MTAGKKCKNCDFEITNNYCSLCGQRTSVHKVTFKETLQDFAASMFSVEGPLLNTLKLLCVNPGRLFREFLAGKRKGYYKPVSFFILTTVIYLLIRSLLNYDPFQDNSLISVGDDTPDSLDVKRLTLARHFFLLNIDKLLLVFTFTLAIFLKLFFNKKNTLAEFVAISFYIISVYMIFATLNMFYMQYVESVMQIGALLGLFVYFNYAMVSYFRIRKLLVLLKSISLFFLALFSFMMIAFGISYLIVPFTS